MSLNNIDNIVEQSINYKKCHLMILYVDICNNFNFLHVELIYLLISEC